jgi:light-regulated signal transduction histidine kinase (bacteriophytochrome)
VIKPEAPSIPPFEAPTEPAQGLPDEHGVAALSESDQEVLRYALSHDLRAPLRVVDGFTRILKEDYGKVLDRVGNDHLDRVLAASNRMNGMIDAILAQAQLAREPVERQAIDLSLLAKDVVQDLSDLERDQGLVNGQASRRVEFKVADGMLAEADPTLVRRVLDNLMGNALKYSAKVDHPCIEVGVMAATNPAVFYVKDNGAGFDMQHADKLFGLFQRLHSAKEFPGTGVGLAGVKNIISRHEGRVWAEAQAGKGACFYFTLISAAQAQAQVRRV